MIVELRRYRCAPGKRDQWLSRFHEIVLPFMISKGMVALGSFLDQDDSDVHVWLRRFDDEEHRTQLYKAVYESSEWRDDIMPTIKGLVLPDGVEVTRLEPTACSPMR